MTAPADIPTAHFHFDPSCPLTWLTSRWLLEVAKVRPLRVSWHLMSLSVLNEGRADDPEGDPEGYLWVPVRICAAVRQEHGEEALARFYTALWTKDASDERDWLNDLHESLERAGLPRTLAEAGMTTTYDEAVRASHARAVALVGDNLGTPVIAVDEPPGESGEPGRFAVAGHRRRTAFFGPVISRVPTGEQAGRLWDGLLLVASTPGFHEVQTSRPTAP
ncbi:disulfide bond formation protein DsbA [Streptomyces ovatisporus]|uniref:Disulfide bond formation protein DsbA n=1 Tax=Streptomyces ovatisporus TaxID=1128682 RepID=A0ABV9AAE2_9ACTN